MRRYSKLVDGYLAKGYRYTHQLPFGKVHAYDLIKRGLLTTILIKDPGRKLGIRLVEPESVEAYMKSLVVVEQYAEKQTQEASV
jgi:hypothetical protein